MRHGDPRSIERIIKILRREINIDCLAECSIFFTTRIGLQNVTHLRFFRRIIVEAELCMINRGPVGFSAPGTRPRRDG